MTVVKRIAKKYLDQNYCGWLNPFLNTRINTKEQEIMNRYDAKTIGSHIRDRRSMMKITQEKLAEEAEITSKYVGILEHGGQTMSAEILFNLAMALKSSPDTLLGYSTDDDFEIKEKGEQPWQY
jgi:DNA-binding XRE family transcriptional regulator